MAMVRLFFTAVRESFARLLRSSVASRLHPHVVFGVNVSVGPDCYFGNSVKLLSDIKIANSSVGSYSYIGGSSQVKHTEIGKFCSIGPGVNIGLGVHPIDRVSTYPGFYSQAASGSYYFGVDQASSVKEHLTTKMGHDVWIGAGAVILGGVSIGNGAIVGAGAIVTRDVEPYSIVAGVPARVVRKRFSVEVIDALERVQWWDKGYDFLVKNAQYFNSPEDFIARFDSDDVA